MHEKTKERSVRVFGSRKNQNLYSYILKKSVNMTVVSEFVLKFHCKELLALVLKLIQSVDTGLTLNE